MEPILFNSNTTIIWPCRKGDYVLWCGFKGLTSSNGNEYTINDVWQLVNGNLITLTNREPDLPSWFHLHPTECAGDLAYKMVERLNSGYQAEDSLKGPNIWRILAGDRLVWVGEPRLGAESNDGILSVITFNNNAVALGESNSSQYDFDTFGGFVQENQSKEELHLCENGWNIATKMGTPRTASAGIWSLG